MLVSFDVILAGDRYHERNHPSTDISRWRIRFATRVVDQLVQHDGGAVLDGEHRLVDERNADRRTRAGGDHVPLEHRCTDLKLYVCAVWPLGCGRPFKGLDLSDRLASEVMNPILARVP